MSSFKAKMHQIRFGLRQWRIQEGGGWGTPNPIRSYFFKKQLFPCKRYTFCCAYLRKMRTKLINYYLPPPFKIFGYATGLELRPRPRWGAYKGKDLSHYATSDIYGSCSGGVRHRQSGRTPSRPSAKSAPTDFELRPNSNTQPWSAA